MLCKTEWKHGNSSRCRLHNSTTCMYYHYYKYSAAAVAGYFGIWGSRQSSINKSPNLPWLWLARSKMYHATRSIDRRMFYRKPCWPVYTTQLIAWNLSHATKYYRVNGVACDFFTVSDRTILRVAWYIFALANQSQDLFVWLRAISNAQIFAFSPGTVGNNM
jgi:hypothetical protein